MPKRENLTCSVFIISRHFRHSDFKTFRVVQMDCSKEWSRKWTVHRNETGCSNLMVFESGRSWNPKVDGPKEKHCKIWRNESGRSQGIKLRGVQNFSAKSLWRRIYHVMAYARNQNFSAFSNHLIFPQFLSETTVTWQIKILVRSQFQNFSAFSNNCDLNCPKLIFHSGNSTQRSLVIYDS